ncbi:unnamed protein product [Schistosoma mattheei]|uniref:Uncharacterized protein n=1 Tax=Schistosoma mattheei TaxID=31246 RepID=A0A183NJJ3_9TREM|nr:unnamed protein product [Schistosoma mattheei]
MVVGGSRQETLDPGFVLLGTPQQGVPVTMRELVLPDGFDPVSISFTVRDVIIRYPGLDRPPVGLRCNQERKNKNTEINNNGTRTEKVKPQAKYTRNYKKDLMQM